MINVEEVAENYLSGLSKTELEFIVKHGVDLENHGGMEDALEREIMALAELKVFEMRSSRVG